MKPLDLDLLTADEAALLLNAKRSTILSKKKLIGFTKPVKEVYFRFEDVARYALLTTYRPPANMEVSEQEIQEFIQRLRKKLKAA